MNYERVKKESEYNHFLFKGANGESICLIGVDKNICDEQIELYIDTPLINYSYKFWELFFQLSQDNRILVMNIAKKLGKQYESPKSSFNIHYWSVFTDFLFTRYDVTLFDIAGEITGKKTETQIAKRKTVYDRLDKLRNIKSKPRIETMILIKVICAYYLVSYDLITKGRGYIYTLKTSEIDEEKLLNYNVKKIEEIIEKLYPKNVDTKKLILYLTGLDEKDIEATRIEIWNKDNVKNSLEENFLILTMEELYKKQK